MEYRANQYMFKNGKLCTATAYFRGMRHCIIFSSTAKLSGCPFYRFVGNIPSRLFLHFIYLFYPAPYAVRRKGNSANYEQSL